jgi:hypothetical protein
VAGLVVRENNLQVQVSSLRKLLGAQSVATVPGRGYRFTLEPEIDETAPASPLPPRRHNLPSQLTSFIGRQQQIADVCEALGTGRLATLVSVGGAGKSRLSLQVGARLLLEFPDGVWFVELAPVSDEQRVPHALAAVLGVKEDAGRPMIEALARHAQGKRMLVILDNCEHVLKGSADLAKQLLRAGENVRVLASSREPLHVAGEAIYQVGVLDDAEAMRLFVDRTAAVQPDFEVTTQNSHHVADICQRLTAYRRDRLARRAHARHVGRGCSARLADCTACSPAATALRASRRCAPRSTELRPADLPERVLCAARVRGRMDVGGAEPWPGAATSGRDSGGPPHAPRGQVARGIRPEAGRYRLLETVRQYAHELLAPPARRTTCACATCAIRRVATAPAPVTGPQGL